MRIEAPTLRRQYAKLCEAEDFDDPGLRARIRELQLHPDPDEYRERKLWELGMTALFLEEVGALHRESSILSVGAGHEPLLFWLANRVGSIVATDIYGTGDFESWEASAAMLEDPARLAPFAYDEDRLSVRTMDARDLELADGSFDAVYSLSSIEHFGSAADIRRAVSEIGRVLRPGGHAFLVTEYLLRLHPLDRAGPETALRLLTRGRHRARATLRRRDALDDAFTKRELRARVIDASGLELMQPVDFSTSAASWENVGWYERGSTELTTRSGDPYPMITLKISRSTFTSIALPLHKPL